ncbi:hypothetical protein [Flavobacterium sp.]|jgi:hypothetical protein|uniref:hypothetical protein n=1 Tax=Flavobacterium sp. TaxID=239 RepID=UPI002616A59E|nr:hypothetical protein [Flavobacterium sp.]
MKTTFGLLTFLLLITAACQQNKGAREMIDFPESRQWVQNDAKKLTLTLKEAGTYSAFVEGSVIYGSQFPSLPMTWELTGTNRNENGTLSLALKNEKGEELGDCTGDVCDVKQALFTGKPFEAGTYTFTLKNTFEFPYFPNIIALGISLEKEK